MGLAEVKNRIAQALSPTPSGLPPSQNSLAVGRGFAGGYLDNLHVDACGIIRLQGWCREPIATDQSPAITVDGQPVPLLQHFRFPRPDVASAACGQTGVAWEYFVPDSVRGPSHSLQLQIPGGAIHFDISVQFNRPDYWPLFDSDQVHHRQHIYGSGPPNKVIHPDVLDLARRLPGPVLDFGCGQGTLIAELLKAGTEAQGIELDSPVLRAAIPPALSERITLYNGAFPSPFAEASFRSVVCSEVLEHIPDYRAAVADIARIATERVVFTVPDASAIPIGHRHGLVPWHLLESTHLNFFNQRSLAKLLEPFFRQVEFGRVGLAAVNDSFFHVSLTASCYK